jgi:hypothetical protein
MAILNNSNAISSGGYDINNSLRLRSSASAYLNRTAASAGNRQTWTMSMWVKRGVLSTDQNLFNNFEDSPYTNEYVSLYITSSNVLDLYCRDSGATVIGRLITTQVFRDPSAWYHIVVVADTTNATSANRLRLYVNGNQITAFSTATYPSQNANLGWNLARQAWIAAAGDGVYFDGYMAEVNFIDGQALTPSSFGSTNATTGVWQPAKYTGTYGTNGFYLPFSDIATTSGSNAGLGKDFSGNGNFWNTNNISVTAGTTYDAMIDSPTLTSATVANYCVLNPLKNGGTAPSSGNLNVVSTVDNTMCLASIGMSSGKWYWEQVQTAGSVGSVAGIAQDNAGLSTYIGGNANSWGYHASGLTYTNATSSSYGNTWTVNDIIGVAFDADNGKLYFSKNGTFQNSGNPVTGTNPAYSSLTTAPYFPAFQTNNSTTSSINFGQRPFTYTPPSGFVRLNTFNLPTPTILQGNKYMDATLWTGVGPASQVIVNQALFKPDLVWVKNRSSTRKHNLYDSVRGTSKRLVSNDTAAEDTVAGVTAFNSNGMTLGDEGDVNANGLTFVGWQWQAGQGSTSSNTAGSITTTTSVNATAGFSVFTFTGTGASASVGHGLGVAPKFMVFKRRNSTSDWNVLTNAAGSNQYGFLNLTTAFASAGETWTSTVINIGGNFANGGTYVCYAWAEIAGFSKFGSYTGNGSTDGPFVYLGFRPEFVMIKRTDSTGEWLMFDTSRSTYNQAKETLLANSSGAEVSYSGGPDILSNGFKNRGSSGNTDINASGGTYIYAAFAENPFKNANAR